jgi:hypothetical protein
VASHADSQSRARAEADAPVPSEDHARGERSDSEDATRTPDADEPRGADFELRPTPVRSDQLPEDAPAPVADD